jgi:phage terminase small subunit
MGRPPKPLEVKRRTGRAPGRDSGGRKLPEVVSILRMSDDTPEPPADLGLEGTDLWRKAWAAAITWLSEDSDWTAVVNACRAADDLAIARRRYNATSDPGDGRAVVALGKALTDALSVLGFDPTSRSKLGVAEVKKATALEQLLANRAKPAR